MVCLWGLIFDGRAAEVGEWIWGWCGWVGKVWEAFVVCVGKGLEWYLVG